MDKSYVRKWYNHTFNKEIILGILHILMMLQIIFRKILLKKKLKIPYQIFNIGNSKPYKITKMLDYLKFFLKNKNPKIKLEPMQVGDVYKTHSNSKK